MTKKEESTDMVTPEPVIDYSKQSSFQIEGPSGTIYTVKRPMGRLGSKHFSLMTKAIPSSVEYDEDGNPMMSPADVEKINEVFFQWTEQILPHIIDAGLYDTMSGEDQYGLFMAMFNTMNLNKELFRFVG